MASSKTNIAEDRVRTILSESVLTIAQARVELQKVLGKRPDRATIHRWILRGVGGCKLEAVRIGPAWVTSAEAINRFIIATTSQAIS